VANLGRNTGRVTAAVMTVGMSELGLAFTKNCRICGHKLSLHGGADYVASAPQPVVIMQQPAPQVAVPQQAPQGPPPGWYADKQDPSIQRWWDGVKWTEHTQ
jgi:hypothetical protein